MTDNDFKIILDFGGGEFEATVKTTWRSSNSISTFEVLVDYKRIAQLEMEDRRWATTYGNLDDKTVQYIGEKIDWYFTNPK